MWDHQTTMGRGDTPDPTSREKVVHTLVIPPQSDDRLKSLAVYQTTTHPREFYWSEDKVITCLVGLIHRNHLISRVLTRPARLCTDVVGTLSPPK